MKKAKVGIIITSVCVVAFLAGITTGFLKNRREREVVPPYVEKAQAAMGEEETVEEIASVECYRVKAEGDYVLLYEVFDDNTKTEIERLIIDKKILPKDEIEIFEKGIDFFEKEEALMVMESLIS